MLMLHSGDTLIRVVAFLLMFAPLGSTLSLDSFIFGKRLKKTARPGLVSWWAPRMIQLQLSALYCITAYWKTVGLSWADGTAVYYALHLFEFRKFPVPESSHLWAYAILSWATVAIELSCGILIWSQRISVHCHGVRVGLASFHRIRDEHSPFRMGDHIYIYSLC